MKASVIVEMDDGSILSMSVLLRDGDLSLVRPGTPRSCCGRNADNQGCDCPVSSRSEVGSVSLRGELLSCETSFR